MSRAGRVLSVSTDGDQGRAVTLQLPGGDLGTVELAWDAPTVAVGDLVRIAADGALERVHAHPGGDYPAPETDGARFSTPGRWDRLRRRAELIERTRSVFRARGLLEVETPAVVDSPGTEVHLAPTRVVQRDRPGRAERTRWLITSPEHHMKRLLSAGAPPIFQISRVWRDAEHGQNHRAEFTMLEWYRPWADLDAIVEDCEAWIRGLAGGDTLRYRGASYDLRTPWHRVPFLEALEHRGGIREPERLTPDEQLAALVGHVEPGLGRERPELLVDYPIAFASLARPKPGHPELAERFELYLAGLELANAFGELTDAAEQRRRCVADNAERRALGLPQLPLDEAFLHALAEGMPPSAGIAAGLDRVIMLLSDAADIDEVLAF